ncbi:HIRAN domain-containing protein [Novosphingobium sp. fls2-241-R2A-195]|uniref:HIRAN domain-containing protein n=1 Tax=Novosphingobium sp. fls2-241-R2A-195 TaxID=3040296 RepID=UPI00254FDFBA|nr:HIRAN domain-containing protein [Novosphingobium sp. fls2-241-R2A-195]
MLPALSLAVVGADYPNKGKMPGRRFEIALCAPGDPLELRPEPKNPADENAIAVYSERDVQIGYVTAERAPRIGQLIRQGHTITAIFQEATCYGAVARLAFDGEQPTLPDIADGADDESIDDFDQSPNWRDPDGWPA